MDTNQTCYCLLAIDVICCLLTGWLFDVTGTYVVPFYVAGSAIAAGGIICLPLRSIGNHRRSTVSLVAAKQGPGESVCTIRLEPRKSLATVEQTSANGHVNSAFEHAEPGQARLWL